MISAFRSLKLLLAILKLMLKQCKGRHCYTVFVEAICTLWIVTVKSKIFVKSHIGAGLLKIYVPFVNMNIASDFYFLYAGITGISFTDRLTIFFKEWLTDELSYLWKTKALKFFSFWKTILQLLLRSCQKGCTLKIKNFVNQNRAVSWYLFHLTILKILSAEIG